jgi:Protein of unknown function (DUF1566)
MTTKDQANRCTRSRKLKVLCIKISHSFLSRLRFYLAVCMCVFLVACGGGSSSSNATAAKSTASAVLTSNTTVLSTEQVASTTVVVNSDTSTMSMTAPSGSALAQLLEPGKTLLIKPGDDPRYPMGASLLVRSTTQANGSVSAELVPATLADTFKDFKTSHTDVALGAENFVGVIAPSAVKNAPAQAGTVKLAPWQGGITALNGALVIRNANKTNFEKAADAVAQSLGNPFDSEGLTFSPEIKLGDLVDDPTKISPIGAGVEAKIKAKVSIKNLKLTNAIDWSGAKGQLSVQGDVSGEVKITGGFEAKLGSFNNAWKEVERDGLLVGLESKDKIGRIPIAGFQFVLQCLKVIACPVPPGTTQTVIRETKSIGVIVWLYVTADGVLSLDGSLGTRINDLSFKTGIEKKEGTSWDDINVIREFGKKAGSSTEVNLIEMPFLEGEFKANYKLGIAIDTDMFIMGVRVANVALDFQNRANISAKGTLAYVLPDFGQDWRTSWDTNLCLTENLGTGLITNVRLRMGYGRTSAALPINFLQQWPKEEEILKPGPAGIISVGGLSFPTWRTWESKNKCFPVPKITKVSVQFVGYVAEITVTGENLPGDLELTIAQSTICSGVVKKSISDTQAVYTCNATNGERSFDYSFSSVKASNLDTSAVTGRWSNAPTQTPTITSVAGDGVVILPPAPPISLGVRPATSGGAIEVSQGGYTTDTTPTVSGTVSAALTATQTLRVYDGSTILGTASVSGSTWSYTPSTALPLGSRSFSAKVSSVDGIEGAASNTWAANIMGVSSISPSAAQVNVPTTFAVSGGGLPLTAVLALADSTCQTPTARAATGFSVVCTPLSTGDKIATVKTDTQANSGQVIDASKIVKVSTTGAATGKLPHSGITSSQCYQAGSNALVACSSAGALALSSQQDGMRTLINPISYTKISSTGAELPSSATTWCAVKDNVTGLIWENHNAPPVEHADFANSDLVAVRQYLSENANKCALSGWRMPTEQELQTIVDYGVSLGSSKTIDLNYFPFTGRWYFSANGVGKGSSSWGVSFDTGAIGGLDQYSGNDHARLVIGTEMPNTGRYVVSSDGTEVTDTKTGLIWARCSVGQVWNGSICANTPTTFTHEAALSQAKNLAVSTGKAWRLPNVKELASITDKSFNNPVVDSTIFPNTSSGGFWSSSPSVGVTYNALGVYFNYGYMNGSYRSSYLAVRLVRSAADIGLDGSGVFDVAANTESGTPFNVPSGVSTCSFAATGSWRWNAFSAPSPPEGAGSTYGGYVWKLPSAPAFSLIGQNASGYQYFGRSKSLTVTPGEIITLLMNDTVGAYVDNSGALIVAYSCQ